MIIIVSSFLILVYFQNQSTFLGNSINISGKNRFLAELLYTQINDYSIDVNIDNPVYISFENQSVLVNQHKVSVINLRVDPPLISDIWFNDNTYSIALIFDGIINPTIFPTLSLAPTLS